MVANKTLFIVQLKTFCKLINVLQTQNTFINMTPSELHFTNALIKKKHIQLQKCCKASHNTTEVSHNTTEMFLEERAQRGFNIYDGKSLTEVDKTADTCQVHS